jgi:hypothetical protein
MDQSSPERKGVINSEVAAWVERLEEPPFIRDPDRQMMAEFLILSGANLDAVKGHEGSMRKWTNEGMVPAVEAVWGSQWQKIQEFNEEFIADYEKRTGRTLPHINIYKKGTHKQEVARITKQSSMKHFLGLMTRWAVFKKEEDPEFDSKRFSDEVVVRVLNGLSREQGITDLNELSSLIRPDTKEEYQPSIPPSYPKALINYLISIQK